MGINFGDTEMKVGIVGHSKLTIASAISEVLAKVDGVEIVGTTNNEFSYDFEYKPQPADSGIGFKKEKTWYEPKKPSWKHKRKR